MEPVANDPAVASPRPPQLRRLYLTLAAAYGDTLGFIGLFGLFTAHVTGNFVLIGSELVNRHADILTKSLALPVFVVSVALTAQAEMLLRRRGAASSMWLLATEALLIACAAVTPAWLGFPAHPDDLPSVIVGFLLVAALGVQNALMRTSLAGPVQTTVMTGNVTQLSIDLTAIWTGRADLQTEERARQAWPAVACFAVGSALGAGGYALMQFDSLWIAVGLVAAAACLSRVRSR